MKASEVFVAFCFLQFNFILCEEEATTCVSQDPVRDRDEIAFVKIGSFRKNFS